MFAYLPVTSSLLSEMTYAGSCWVMILFVINRVLDFVPFDLKSLLWLLFLRDKNYNCTVLGQQDFFNLCSQLSSFIKLQSSFVS